MRIILPIVLCQYPTDLTVSVQRREKAPDYLHNELHAQSFVHSDPSPLRRCARTTILADLPLALELFVPFWLVQIDQVSPIGQSPNRSRPEKRRAKRPLYNQQGIRPRDKDVKY